MARLKSIKNVYSTRKRTMCGQSERGEDEENVYKEDVTVLIP